MVSFETVNTVQTISQRFSEKTTCNLSKLQVKSESKALSPQTLVMKLTLCLYKAFAPRIAQTFTSSKIAIYSLTCTERNAWLSTPSLGYLQEDAAATASPVLGRTPSWPCWGSRQAVATGFWCWLVRSAHTGWWLEPAWKSRWVTVQPHRSLFLF